MPIMAVQDQNDVRGSARLLANTAKKCVDEFAYTPGDKVALNGIFRLLKAFRSHGLAGFEYQPRQQRGPEALTIFPPAERHIGDLRAALASAITEVYRDEDQDTAIESLENVLRSVAKRERPAQEELKRTSDFLGSFVQNLHAAG